MSRRDLASVLDIVLAARLARDFVNGMTREEFLADLKTQAAVIRQIEIMGEAVRRLSQDYRKDHPEIPWGDIAGMRSVLIHDYDEVDLGEVWKDVESSIPELLGDLEPLVPKDE